MRSSLRHRLALALPVTLAATCVLVLGGTGTAYAACPPGSGTGSSAPGTGSALPGTGSRLPGTGSALPGSSEPGVTPIPWLNGQDGRLPQLKGTTTAVAHMTGLMGDNDTVPRFGVLGTDLGIMWDNGEGQVLAAFGDTFGFNRNPFCGLVGDWRSNVLFRSTDRNLSDGMSIDSAPLDRPNHARELIESRKVNGVEITTIPTAGIAVGGVQYLDFMSVRSWGAPGEWHTNFSALASSTDNGETWTVHPLTARLNESVSGNANFQMGAFVEHDGWIYKFGTPSGRNGAAHLARVRPESLLDPLAYEHWDGIGAWVPTDPKAAGVVIPGPVSELSVAYNEHLGGFVALYTDATNSIVARTSATLESGWSEPKVLVSSRDVPSVYGAFIHPWSSGKDLYYLASTWSDYNVMLLRTDLEAAKLPKPVAPPPPA